MSSRYSIKSRCDGRKSEVRKDCLWTIRARTAVDTQVAVVWRPRIASIAAPIAKRSRQGPRFPVSADIRSVLAKLIETTDIRESFGLASVFATQVR